MLHRELRARDESPGTRRSGGQDARRIDPDAVAPGTDREHEEELAAHHAIRSDELQGTYPPPVGARRSSRRFDPVRLWLT